MRRIKSGISRTVAVVSVIVIVLIIAAGIGYVALTQTSNTTTTSVTTTKSSTSTFSTTHSQTSQSQPSLSTYAFTLGLFDPTRYTASSPIEIVENQNLLSNYDPNAQVQLTSGDISTIQEVLTGKYQVAMGTGAGVTQAIAKGDNLTIVASWIPSPPSAIVVGATSNITSLDQIPKDAVWVTNNPGTLAYIETQIVAQQYGLGNLSLVYVSASTQEATILLSGKATAAWLAYPVIAAFPGIFKPILNLTSDWPLYVIYSTPSFVNAHPDAVKAAIATLLQAGSIYDANAGNSTLNMLLNLYPTISVDGARTLISILQYSNNGSISLGVMQDMINAYYQYHALSNNLTASSIVTPGFVTVTK